MKPCMHVVDLTHMPVAPRAGAWIETIVMHESGQGSVGRPPRGGVD